MPRCSAIVVAAGVVALLVAACSPEDGPPQSQADVERALEHAGLTVCAVDDQPVDLEGVDDAVELSLAVDGCDGDQTGDVVVATHPSESERDRIDAAVLAVPRPRFADAIWKLGTTTVVLAGDPDDEVVDRVQDAMEELGAA